MTPFSALYWAVLKSGISSHGTGWTQWDVSLKEGAMSEALEPMPTVEEAGAGAFHTYLALLDGDHIRETAQHPGTICKHRNFWLITEVTSVSNPTHRTTPGF